MMIKKILFFLLIIFILVGFIISEGFGSIILGIALLLFGMQFLETGFTTIPRGAWQATIQRLSKTLFGSISIGFVLTGLFQSSSLVSILTISFISTGFLSLKAGLGIVYGANVGTTVTAWIVALFGLKFDMTLVASPLLVLGILLNFQAGGKQQSVGKVLVGLGFFLVGVNTLKLGFENLGDYSLSAIPYTGPVRFLVMFMIGAALTAILQSSSAVITLVLASMTSGYLSYEDSIVITIGANVGTTATALLGSIAVNYQGKRLAVGHLVFNLITALVTIILFNYILKFNQVLVGWLGIGAEDYTLQLATFQTLFNLLGVVIMLPLTGLVIKRLRRWVKRPPEPEKAKPLFLNETVLKVPHSTRLALYKESERMFSDVKNLVSKSLVTDRPKRSIKDLEREIKQSPVSRTVDIDFEYDMNIKPIFGKIVKYSSSLDHSEFKEACLLQNRRMAMMVKQAQLLQSNMINFTSSNDPLMRRQYDIFRFLIGSHLYISNRITSAEKLEQKRVEFEKIQEQAANIEQTVVSAFYSWFDKKSISSKDASSILNDAHEVYNLCRNIHRITLWLYGDVLHFLEIKPEEEESF